LTQINNLKFARACTTPPPDVTLAELVGSVRA
jgi:hypothetical protein